MNSTSRPAADYHLATSCRGCAGTSLDPILSLGSTPLANRLVTAEELADPSFVEPRFPLDLVFCPACTLVQITASVAPEVLFSEYPYFSSQSQTMGAHVAALALRTAEARNLGKDSLVLEIASNDGYLLRRYLERGIGVLGVEPAGNVAQVARACGVPTRTEFFGRAFAETLALEGVQADVVHAHNVLAHVPDVHSVIAGIAVVLKENGIAIVETPYVRDMVDHGEFDTIYHEHLFYYSLTSLRALFEAHGLEVVDVERVAIHGGSLRVTVAHRGAQPAVSIAVGRMLFEERTRGLDTATYYRELELRVESLRVGLGALLAGFSKRGHARMIGYGASAKGSTLLNCLGIGRETLSYVVDCTPAKIGKFTPGTHLPIVSPEVLATDTPHAALLLTWNFVEEILARESAYRARGGRFIVPIPHLVVR